MARKKYIRDYRLIETVDERGRIRSDYEYIGKRYAYVLGAEAARREKRLALALCLVGWLAYFAALLPPSETMRTVYAALPLLLAAIPLGVMTDTLFSAAPAKEPLLHRQADMLENRYPPAALWTAILPGASLLGTALRLMLGGTWVPGDLAPLLASAVLVGAGVLLFSRRRRFACRETE